jgi:hypothetical protein
LNCCAAKLLLTLCAGDPPCVFQCRNGGQWVSPIDAVVQGKPSEKRDHSYAPRSKALSRFQRYDVRRVALRRQVVSFLCELEPSLRHHKPTGLHVGHVGQPRHGKTRHALAMILTKIWFCLSHGAVGCSKNQTGFGALFVGKSAISKSAFMKIKGNQNSIGIVDLISPLCIMTGRRWLVNIPFDIGN